MKLFALTAAILLLAQTASAQKKSWTHEIPESITRTDGLVINDPNMLKQVRAAMSASATPGNGILYHGGSVMTSTVTVYYIWYGNWNGNDAIALLENLASKIGGTSYFNINSSYTDGSGSAVRNAVLFGGSTTDNYSQGKSLSDGQLWQVVSTALASGKLPIDPNGMYFVLTSADVTAASGFCTRYCGWHSYGSLSGMAIKFSFVGDSSRCISACAAQPTSPNGNPGADGMASVIAHELSETVTDPTLDAWYDNGGNENADKCAWTFGATFAATNGSRANVTLGKYNYLIQQNWINASGGQCGLQYVVPTASSISPSAGTTGAVVPMTLTGTNFAAGANLTISGSGITTSNLVVVSSTQINATLNVAANASLGAHTVAVTLGAAVSTPVNFTVSSTAVTRTGLSPASGAPGAVVPFTLTGTNFATGAAVQVSGTGVAVSGVTMVSPTQIRGQLAIDKTAAPGTRNLTVAVGSSVTAAMTFTITPSIPTITAVSPATGATGSSVQVTVTGTNFGAGATLNISGAGVAVSNVVVTGTTQIKAQLTIDKAAAAGTRGLTVSVAGAASDSAGFAVTSPAPTLSGISPASGGAGAIVQITLTGTNIQPGATVAVSGTGVAVSGISVSGSTQLKAQLTIDKAAAAGARSVTVNLGSGVSAPLVFTVIANTPALTGISPATGAAGSTVAVTLTGSNFVPGAALNISGSGVTAGNVAVVSATQASVLLTIDRSAATGARNMMLSSGSNVTAAQTFTITPASTGPVPTISSMSPGGYGTGLATGAAIYGGNFAPGAKINFSGTGVSAANVSVNSANLLTFNLSIDANAAVGPRSVTVVTGSGTSAPYSFVVNPAGPIVKTVTPASGTSGSTVVMTLTGTGFTPDSYIVANATGIAIGKTVFVSPTQMTVQLTLGGATGQRFLLVVVPSTQYVITSTPVYITINPSAGSH